MLLINPSSADYGGKLGRFTPLSLPMSIGCLASVMIDNGYNGRIWDEEVVELNWDNLDEAVKGLPKPYIFGISMTQDEKQKVIEEAKEVYGVEEVVPSIILVEDLSRNKN